MRAIWITKHGGPEVLAVRETPDPEPKDGEVRVRVKAAGLNFAEMMARQGLYPDAPKPPCVVGYEAAGVVDKVGAGVTRHAPGARVIALSRFGAHADTVCVPERQALAMPDAMTFEEGAALPVNYITAYHMLFRVGNVRPGERVLIHMAAGGVGIAALQLCKTVARVETIGTASESKHAFLKAQGCHHTIDYRTRDYVDEVKKLTDGRGVDIVLDALGGADWKKGYELLRPAGRLIAFGFANMASGSTRNLFHVVGQFVKIPRWSPLALMDTNRTIAGVNIGHLWSEMDMLTEEMDALIALYREGKIAPHVDSTFTFEQAGEAQRRMSERKNVGKIVLVP